eukprot:TRINITY_DN23932_c0_g2_i1.p1 TRINITY_DN23932_c0_g2~~TRINITY_DN23932_c0_g2_i1.p1  ORF type:complete len:356 (+),score=63.40 TRINITY_DN23932_c0_g2_i1:89-1156(+)
MSKDAEHIADEETPLMPDGRGTRRRGSVAEMTQQAQFSTLSYMCALTVVVFLVGILLGVKVEGWDAITAVYVLTQTVTTVGYGDVTPTHPAVQLYYSFLVLYTLATGTYVASSQLYKSLSKAHEDLLHSKLTRAAGDGSRDEQCTGGSAGVCKPVTPLGKLAVASIPAILVVIFGTVFYAVFESCTCSYGKTRVHGCIDTDYASCAASGGWVKSWPAAFYMSIITLTTVGYGDYSPRSQLGRAVAVLWMIFGVLAVGNWIKGISDFFAEIQDGSHEGPQSIDHHVFDLIDKSGDGSLSKSEYVNYVLIKYGMVTEDDLDMIESQYDEIDELQTGCVTLAQIERAEKKRKVAGDEA